MIKAFWFNSQNFGDALTHYIIGALTGITPVFVERNYPNEHYIISGSILNHANEYSIVWGAGIADRRNEIMQPKRLISVRGKMTQEMCNRKEIVHEGHLGDASLIMPLIFNPQKSGNDIAILPHYMDRAIVEDKFADYRIIDILNPVEQVIEEIKECKTIISSSLHGLIMADVYGIANHWVLFSDNILGDNFKYYDYYTTTQEPQQSPVYVHDATDLEYAIDRAAVKETIINIEEYAKTCPFWKF